ncbi:uncharacterized protein LOC115759162 [Drosophila novamexicana]|uniref:uncharacterized protein LOC115759162 n=1 Tax=Drosophila novamexicana TaxID=47314 RepID=UPI0011E5EBC2|nr:uncharacterized protein LOC115759162 [Drosophila novamexicana]
MLKKEGKQSQRILDSSHLTPYDLIRNCKTFSYCEDESYPSIWPPITRCGSEFTSQWLSEAAEKNCCERPVNMEIDDIVEVWKQIPYKDTLSYYGIGADIPTPEAVVFNQAILKCLDEVKPEGAAVKIPKNAHIPVRPQKHETNAWGALVLNRQLLSSKITQMPVVQRKLYPKDIGSWLHCRRPTKPGYPFIESQTKVPPTSALDMGQPAPKPKHGLRRKHMYCELQCNIAENTCTDYEWKKYKQDPKPHEVALQMEMAQVKEEKITEPRNYDELYSELVTCFEQDTNPDPISEIYKRCCKGISEYGQDDLDGGSRGGGDRERRHGDGDADEGSDIGKTAGESDVKKPGEGEGKGGKKGKGKGQRGSKRKSKGGRRGSGKKGIKKQVYRGDLMEPDGEDLTRDGGKKNRSDSSILRELDLTKNEIEREKTELEKTLKLTHTKNKRKKKRKGSNKKVNKLEVSKDCPCDICKFMQRRQDEKDTPLIRQMKQEDKRRQLRDYYKRMCHHQYLNWRKPEYHAPQHKCDGIVCDDIFCRNPKLGEYCECLDAMQKLQKLLGPEHRIVKNELIFNVEDLRRRICKRFCDCL